jgi:hypothetical protein
MTRYDSAAAKCQPYHMCASLVNFGPLGLLSKLVRQSAVMHTR